MDRSLSIHYMFTVRAEITTHHFHFTYMYELVPVLTQAGQKGPVDVSPSRDAKFPLRFQQRKGWIPEWLYVPRDKRDMARTYRTYRPPSGNSNHADEIDSPNSHAVCKHSSKRLPKNRLDRFEAIPVTRSAP